MEEKDALIAKYETKFLKLEGDLLDKSEKLKKANNYCFEQGKYAGHLEEKANTLKSQMNVLLD